MRSASSWPTSSSRSSEPATVAALMIVSARTPSTPARCHSQDGIRRQTAGSGKTRMPAGAGPGGSVPNLDSRILQARCASRITTFCSRIAGTSASISRPDRPSRNPG